MMRHIAIPGPQVFRGVDWGSPLPSPSQLLPFDGTARRRMPGELETGSSPGPPAGALGPFYIPVRECVPGSLSARGRPISLLAGPLLPGRLAPGCVAGPDGSAPALSEQVAPVP